MNLNARFTIPALMVVIASLACSAPSAKPTDTPTVTPIPPTETPIPTPTIAPTPTLMAGWQVYQDPALNVSFHHPEGWEVSQTGPEGLEIHQMEGDGWLELQSVSGTVNNAFALTYTPGMTGDAVIAAILPAARQDGSFGEPQSIATRSIQPAWIIEGRNEVHSEQTIIAALGLPQRALILVGHGGKVAEDWPALSEVYRGIIGSLEAAQ